MLRVTCLSAGKFIAGMFDAFAAQSIRNKMGSGAWLGLDDETFSKQVRTCVYILAREWHMMWRLEPYCNDKGGF